MNNSFQQNDSICISGDERVTRDFDKGEQILYSQLTIKYTNSGDELPRVLVITDRHIYHITPRSTNKFWFFFECLFKRNRIKRRISLGFISGISISTSSNEIVIHVPCEYDQRYRLDIERNTILAILSQAYTNFNYKKLIVHLASEASLLFYTTTTFDAKRQKRRPLPEQTYAVSRKDLMQILEQGDQPQLVFQRNQSNKAIQLNDFEILKNLGSGAFGKVMLCKKKDDKQIFAIKSINKAQIIKKKQIEYIKTERKIFESIENPFLVSLHYCFQDKNHIFFVMKFMRAGELFFHLRQVNKFNEEFTRFYAAQILLALEYLHNMEIVYRDLKPENILMDEDGYIALTDYGLSKIVSKGRQADSMVGTPEYLAPEILIQKGHNYVVDWWSLGVLIYEMLVGRTPFYNANRDTLFKNIISAEFTYPNSTYITQESKSLISLLLKKNPKDRLGSKGAEEIQKHPFFKNFDFDALYNKKIKPPLIPEFSNELDLHYFNSEFTAQKIISSLDLHLHTDSYHEEFYGMTYCQSNKKTGLLNFNH